MTNAARTLTGSTSTEGRVSGYVFKLIRESLGATQQFYRGYVGHTLGTGLRFEPDEFNFFRARRDHGTKHAFRARDSHFTANGSDDGAEE